VPIAKLAPYSIRTLDLERSDHFYERVPGFKVRYRPPFIHYGKSYVRYLLRTIYILSKSNRQDNGVYMHLRAPYVNLVERRLPPRWVRQTTAPVAGEPRRK
jgi:catechol 2,3-dioxygenase-like lactoylglutathione lyase family enzyme